MKGTKREVERTFIYKDAKRVQDYTKSNHKLEKFFKKVFDELKKECNRTPTS